MRVKINWRIVGRWSARFSPVAAFVVVMQGWKDFLVWLFGYFPQQWIIDATTISPLWPASIAGLFVLSGVLFGGKCLLKQELEEVKERRLKILKEPRITQPNDSLQIWEIQVKNTSAARSIPNARCRISIKDRNGNDAGGIPWPQRVSINEKRLDPEDVENWRILDVCYSKFTNGKEMFEFRVNASYRKESIRLPNDRYQVTLSVGGENTKGDTAIFVVRVENGELKVR